MWIGSTLPRLTGSHRLNLVERAVQHRAGAARPSSHAKVSRGGARLSADR
jgi:hypothetical protein